MRGFFGRGVYNGVETQPGGGEDVQEQEMIAQLLQQDERGMEALLLHYGPLMRYIIAPILPDPQDREECLSEVSMRVWSRIAQFDRALFYRKYYYLQSTAQIAAELGMTERAVEGRLYRLKKRLRTMLGGDGDA